MASSYNIAPGESSDAAAQRRRLAMALMMQGADTSPIQHWTQGAARAAQSIIGGLELRREDQKEESEKTAGRDLYSKIIPMLTGGGQSAPAPAASPTAGSRAAVDPATITSPQSAPVKDVYAENEQSPLDPVPGAITPDRAKLLAAIYQGESGGRPNVMYGGKTFDSYADHPRQPQPILGGPNAGKMSTAAGAPQFLASTWDRAKGALNLPDFSPGNQNAGAAWLAGEDYQKRAGGNLDLALSQAGGDPSKLQGIARALAPTWTSLPGGIEANSGGAQFVQNMQSQSGVAQPISEASAQSRVAPPAAQPGAINPEMIKQLLGNKYTAPMAQQIIQQQLQKKLTPDDAAPTVQRVKQPDGSEVAVQWDKTKKTWVPLDAPAGGNPVANPKLTEVQSKDVGFYNRGQKLIPRLEAQDKSLTDAYSAAGGQVPLVGNYLKSDDYRKAENTGRELLAVILRKDTGAAVTPQEFEMYGSIYLPRPGDDPATIQQKRAARATAMEGLRMGLGTAEILFKSREAMEGAKTPAPAASAGGAVEWERGPDGKPRRKQ
jgi:muramidase (phage lysozyme)